MQFCEKYDTTSLTALLNLAMCSWTRALIEPSANHRNSYLTHHRFAIVCSE